MSKLYNKLLTACAIYSFLWSHMNWIIRIKLILPHLFFIICISVIVLLNHIVIIFIWWIFTNIPWVIFVILNVSFGDDKIDVSSLIFITSTNQISAYLSKLYTRLSLTLRWRHNERDGVSNHQRLECLVNRLFMWSKKTSTLPVTGLLRRSTSHRISFKKGQ